MKNSIALTVICFISSLSLYSSTADTSVFTNPFEKSVFKKIEKGEAIDTIDLFLSLDYRPLDGNSKITAYIGKLKARVQDLPINRKLKTIYNEVHAEFLTKYTEEAYFNDIFETGNYNCVTASALFALVLQELGIDFQIKETPDHVYVVADPGKTAYLIESTLPGERLVQFDERLKNQYIEFLRNNKLISESEFNNSSVSELFEKHYLRDKTISLKQLAGLQYYNKGAFLYQKEKFADAMCNFEKARLLNKHDMISYMLNNTLINLLEQETQSKKFNGRILAQYVNLNDSNSLGLEFARDFFGTVSSELIINHPNLPLYQDYFSDFSGNVRSPDINDINRTYYFFIAYHYAVNYEYSSALSCLKKAYVLNTENVLTRQLVSECIYKMTARLGYVHAIDSLNSYADSFPFLRNDENMITLFSNVYVTSISQCLSDEQFKTAEYLLSGYETFLRENPAFNAEQKGGEAVYQQFGYYHMQLMELDRAEYFLRKGIRMFPGSTVLKGQLRSLMSMRGGSYEYPELMADSNPMKKYLLAIAVAKDNREITNKHVANNLKQVWEGYTGTDSLLVKIEEGNKIQLKDNKGTFTGTWNYNSDKCVLTMQSADKLQKRAIVITQLLPGQLKGIIYSGEDFKRSVDITLKSRE